MDQGMDDQGISGPGNTWIMILAGTGSIVL